MPRRVRPLRLSAAALAVGLGALTSCGPAGPKLYPVTGKVLFEGQPAEGAMIVFHPEIPDAEGRMPGAAVAKDGSFTLRTYPYGEGAQEGDYKVALTWLYEKGGDQVGNKLPARYADPNKSGLKATVKPGPNSLEPFRLTKSP